MRYYFAYGSNMFPEQMEHRCPKSEPVTQGMVRGWAFRINERGVATLAKAEKGKVYGGIYEISALDEAYLDIYEGVRSGAYGKFRIPVEVLSRNHLVDCLVYIDPSRKIGAPREGYLERIVAGAKWWRLPKDYVQQLKNWKRR